MTVELTAAEVLKWQCFFYCKYRNKMPHELKQIYKSNVLIYHPDKPPLGCGQKFGILKQEFDDYETWKKINYDRQYYYDDAKEWRNTEHSQAVTAEAQKRTAATRKLEKTAARAARKQKRAEQEAAEQEAAEEKAPQKERTPSPPTFKRQMSPRSKHARTQWYKETIDKQQKATEEKQNRRFEDERDRKNRDSFNDRHICLTCWRVIRWKENACNCEIPNVSQWSKRPTHFEPLTDDDNLDDDVSIISQWPKRPKHYELLTDDDYLDDDDGTKRNNTLITLDLFR